MVGKRGWYLERLGPNRETIRIEKEIMLVGRAVDADIICQDSKVSRRHGEFHLQGNHCCIKDLKSLNGIFVNGVTVSGELTTLNPNDTIGFGAVDANDGVVYILKQDAGEVSEANTTVAASVELTPKLEHETSSASSAPAGKDVAGAQRKLGVAKATSVTAGAVVTGFKQELGRPDIAPVPSTSSGLASAGPRQDPRRPKIELVTSADTGVAVAEPELERKASKLSMSKNHRRASNANRLLDSDSDDEISVPRKKWKKIIVSETDDSDEEQAPVVQQRKQKSKASSAPPSMAELVKRYSLKNCRVVLKRLTEKEIKSYERGRIPSGNSTSSNAPLTRTTKEKKTSHKNSSSSSKKKRKRELSLSDSEADSAEGGKNRSKKAADKHGETGRDTKGQSSKSKGSSKGKQWKTKDDSKAAGGSDSSSEELSTTVDRKKLEKEVNKKQEKKKRKETKEDGKIHREGDKGYTKSSKESREANTKEKKKQNKTQSSATSLEAAAVEPSSKKSKIESGVRSPVMPTLKLQVPVSSSRGTEEPQRDGNVKMTVQTWAKTDIPTVLVKPQPRETVASEYSQPESPVASTSSVGVYSQLADFDEDALESPRGTGPEDGEDAEATSPLYNSDDDIFILDEFIADGPDHCHIKEEPLDKSDEAEYEEELLRWAERLSQDVPSENIKEEPQTPAEATTEADPTGSGAGFYPSIEAPMVSRLKREELPEPNVIPEEVGENNESAAADRSDANAGRSETGKAAKEEAENEEQWWPELSQAFYEEERKEEQNATSRSASRPKPTGHRTLLTDPLPLSASSFHRRLTTAGCLPARPSTYVQKDAPKKGLPPKQGRKVPNMREKLKKDCGLTGYTASVKAGVAATSDLAVLTTKPGPSSAPKSKAAADVHPGSSKAVPPQAKPGPSTSSAAADGARLMPPPAAAPVKAKVTQRNRSSFLTDAASLAPAPGKKKQPVGGMASYRIPKKGTAETNESPAAVVSQVPPPNTIGATVPQPPQKEKETATVPTRTLHSPSPPVGTVRPVLKAPAAAPTRRPSGEQRNHGTFSAQPPLPETVQSRTGILVSHRQEIVERSTRPAVRFSESLQVRTIPPVVSEARAARRPVRDVVYPRDIPRNARPVTDPSAHRICSCQNVLSRIYMWNPNWLTEQRMFPNPPPILKEHPDKLQKLTAMPALYTYHSVAAYMSIFLPLVLHEFWEELTREHEYQLANQKRSFLLQVRETKCNGDFANVTCWGVQLHNDNVSIANADLLHLEFDHAEKVDPAFASIAQQPRIERLTQAISQELHPRLMEAVKKRQDQTILSLVLSTRITTKKTYSPDLVFVCNRLGNIRSVMKYAKAMRKYLVTSPLRDLILDPKFENFRLKKLSELNPSDLVPQVGLALNPSQLEAVFSISDSVLNNPQEPKICLLQGPPGTGKSHVIVAMVLQMLHKARQTKFPRILICAPSNAAIDEIVYRFQFELRKPGNEHFSMVRVGVLNSISPRVRRSALDNIVDSLSEKRRIDPSLASTDAMRDLLREEMTLQGKCSELSVRIENAKKEGRLDEANVYERKLQILRQNRQSVVHAYNDAFKQEPPHERNKRRRQIRMDVLRRANIVASTLSSSANETMDLFRDEKIEFLCCIIDEASQCTEPESLLPLSYNTNKLVFVGDPEQLPATVQSQIAEKFLYNRSLFSRIHGHLLLNPTDETPGLMLDTQYRMHPDICNWPSRYFYGNKLQTPCSLQRGSLLVPYKVLNFLDGQEVIQGKEISNPSEGNLIANLIRALTAYDAIKDKTIGVITFYRRQCGLIKAKIREKCGEVSVDVSTVDGFQGQERDIIILSCVRTDENNVGFVAHSQRLNVALTRARYSLIICGSIPALCRNPGWKELVEDANSRPGVVSAVTTVMKPEYLLSLLTRSTAGHH